MVNDSIVFAGLTPHAPILIPGVGGKRLDEVRSTVASMSVLSHKALAYQPDTLVLISPHSPRHQGAFGVWRTKLLAGSFERFEAMDESVELPLDNEMAIAIEREARRSGLRTWSIMDGKLDHGATVPLWYLAQAGWHGPTVVLSLAYPGGEGLSLLGEAISAAATALGRRTVIIASGDMSHRLSPDAPCGYAPDARVFDEAFVGLIRKGAYERLDAIDAELQETAAEDVVDSTVVAAAAAGGKNDGHAVLSYEGPFGVGYCVAILYSQPLPEGLRTPLSAKTVGVDSSSLCSCDELPLLARRAIRERLLGSKAIPQLILSGELAAPGCVFVTLHDAGGGLRGCIGTLHPTEANLARETWRNALAAAFSDPRFPSIKKDELERLRICVTVLGEMEPARSICDLDTKIYGVVVRAADGRRGVLLPDIEGINTPQQQIDIARRKAGIATEEITDLHRFRVRCYEEEPEQDSMS